MEKVNFGVIGVGNMGSAHVSNFSVLNNCELKAVCDINPEAFKRIDESTRKSVQLFTDAEKFFQEADIDAVIIAVPHYSHPDLAIRAMEYGKHIIVEKPNVGTEVFLLSPAPIYPGREQSFYEKKRQNAQMYDVISKKRSYIRHGCVW